MAPSAWAHSSTAEQPAHNRSVPGSNPGGPTIRGPLVKGLRHRSFKPGSGVRIPHGSPWAISSEARALALQARGRWFESTIAHQENQGLAGSGIGPGLTFYVVKTTRSPGLLALAAPRNPSCPEGGFLVLDCAGFTCRCKPGSSLIFSRYSKLHRTFARENPWNRLLLRWQPLYSP